MNSIDLAGIGMTSQRTRERLINRLIEQGILDQRVLDVIRMTPRHIFLDEALAWLLSTSEDADDLTRLDL